MVRSTLSPAFKAHIAIIGINPYVLLPESTLAQLFAQAGKDKGPIPVHGTIDGHAFIQTLVKYAGAWRLYLNGPMLKAAKRGVGDTVRIRIAFDPRDRSIPMPPALEAALKENNKARKVFDALSPSRRKEIMRYIGHLKSEEAIRKNVARAIGFLEGRERFAGRDKP
ncbi:MAG: DUF1905 domain-containing protein [Flavobacteriales bacterium]|nr:MAG: DUF1905 domain-containing protein [Flavobacteriales bacterium]